MDRYWLTYWLKDPKDKVILPYSDLDVFARDSEAFLRARNQVLFSVPKYEPVAILKIQHVFAKLGREVHLHKDSDKSIEEYFLGVSKAAVNGGLTGTVAGGIISLWHQGGAVAVQKYVEANASNAAAVFWNALSALGSSAGSGAAAAAKTVAVIPDPVTVLVTAALVASYSGYKKYNKIKLSVRATLSPLNYNVWDFHAAEIPPSGLLGSLGW
jgi:hypothetical protein